MEGHSDFGQEDFTIPSRQTVFGDFLDLAQEVADEEARLGVDAGKCEIVVLGLEVELLLLREENREVRNDTYVDYKTLQSAQMDLGDIDEERRRTICHPLNDRVDLAFDPHTDMVTEDSHFPPDSDGSPCKRHQGGRNVSLPELHDHICRFEDREDRERRFEFRIVD